VGLLHRIAPAPGGRHVSLVITEGGILLFLLSIPFGPALPAFVREALLLCVLLGLIFLCFHPGRPSLPPVRFILPLVFFGLSTVASIVFSTYPLVSFRSSRFLPIALLLFLAIQYVATDAAAVRRLCVAMCFVVAILSADGIYQYFTGTSLLTGSDLHSGRVRAGVPHPNDLALIPLLLPLALAIFPANRPAGWRWLLWLILPLVVATVVISRSRNAWIGLAVCMLVWVALGRRPTTTLAALALCAVVFLLAYLVDLGHVRARLTSLARLQADGRIGIWLAAWEMFKDAPLLGQGVHTFGQLYNEFLGRTVLPDGYRPVDAYIPWAHNIYLEMLCERGLLGLAAFLTLVGGAIRRLATALRQSITDEARSYVVGISGSLAVFLVMGLFDLTFYKDWVLVVFWMLLALAARLPDLIDRASPPEADKTQRLK
jgi:O-antigen ligase